MSLSLPSPSLSRVVSRLDKLVAVSDPGGRGLAPCRAEKPAQGTSKASKETARGPEWKAGLADVNFHIWNG